MIETKISLEVAQKEVHAWLENLGIYAEDFDEYKDSIKKMVREVMYGYITFEDFKINQKLKAPILNQITTDTLIYKSRLDVGSVHAKLQGVKPDDGDGRILAYVAALTGQEKGVLRALDIRDYTICTTIALFFIQA